MFAYPLSVSMIFDQSNLGFPGWSNPAQVYWLVDGETYIVPTCSYMRWAEVFETRAEAAAFMYWYDTEGWKKNV